jgi:putative mycofactocin binding protein MftB
MKRHGEEPVRTNPKVNFMRLETVYNLTDGVQVRPEKFGLLFYNYRGPRLYFIPTNDLIKTQFFDGKQSVGKLIESICAKYPAWPRQMVQKWVNRSLDLLEGKNLVYEQSVC